MAKNLEGLVGHPYEIFKGDPAGTSAVVYTWQLPSSSKAMSHSVSVPWLNCNVM